MAKQKKFFAFSLVELMAAVAIVGILVALALPRYRLFIATSRQAEAQSNLGIIATLQQTYQLKYDGKHFTDSFNMGQGGGGSCQDANQKNELGFRVVDCGKLRYTYNAATFGSAKNDGANNSLLIYPGCTGSADEWSITKERVLTNTDKIIEKCHN